MQISKKVTEDGGITIPRVLRQETGILPGVPVDVTADTAGVHTVRHAPACRSCGAVENVAAMCGMEVCRTRAGKIAKVFQWRRKRRESKPRRIVWWS